MTSFNTADFPDPKELERILKLAVVLFVAGIAGIVLAIIYFPYA